MRWSSTLAFACVAAAPILAFGLCRAEPAQSQAASQSSKASSKNATPRKNASIGGQKLIPRSEYVGDEVCGRCHQDKIASYNETAHQKTSQIASKKSIAGDFRPGSNTMMTGNPNLSFRMDAKSDGFFQTAIWGPQSAPEGQSASDATSSSNVSGIRSRTERLDLVIGSGGKGQTYLFWKENQLFQLPVGYSTVLGRWINSAGYKDGTADFERRIIPRCLECHATYFESVLPGPDFNLYDTDNFVLGISCERCHGPGKRHAESYGSKSPARTAVNIVNPAKLSPARRADICAQCHGGHGEPEKFPAFSYVPGQPLEKYIDLGPIDSAADVDVHGKQGKLLMKSRCYQVSGNMFCSTCHDVHKKEPDLAVMSQHCLSCHKIEETATHAKVGEGIAKNCVDCHMPTLESKVVYLDVDGKKVKPRFRTHWIKVYSETERQ